MNGLAIFENPKFGKVRTLEREGEPWFVGKDVAAALGYSNTKDALIKHVDDEDKRLVQRSEIATIENHIPKSVLPMNFVSADIPNRGLTFINESGLYSLVLSSKLPAAKEFKHWVTSEVIPSIRKHGAYMTPEKIEEVLLNPDTIIRLAQELKAEQEARRKLETEAEVNRPKALFADSVSSSSDTILVREMAKILRQNGVKVGQNRLYQWLRENGYLIRQRGDDYNMPTQYSLEHGLMTVKESTFTPADGEPKIWKTAKITGKGQLYFVNKFLAQ